MVPSAVRVFDSEEEAYYMITMIVFVSQSREKRARNATLIRNVWRSRQAVSTWRSALTFPGPFRRQMTVSRSALSPWNHRLSAFLTLVGGGPRVVVSTAAFHARVRGSVPGLGGLKETKMFLPHPRVKVSIVGSLRDREVACSASDRQGSNFESCVWRAVSSQSSHHPQEVLLAQFSLYVHKGDLKPDSFHFIFWRPSPQ